MELPANPKNILYGVYNKFGTDVTKETPRRSYEVFALSDDEDDAF